MFRHELISHARSVLAAALGVLGIAALGCTFESPSVPGATGGAGETTTDAPTGEQPEPTIDCAAWAALNPPNFTPCDPDLDHNNPRSNSLRLIGDTFTYDTDSGMLTDSGGNLISDHTRIDPPGDIDIIAADFVEIRNATLRVIGPRPLVIASWTDIVIAGTVDVSSTAGLPAGEDPSACQTSPPTDGSDGLQPGGAGGGGGAFGANGGAGGPAEDSSSVGGRGGTGILNPGLTLRGGCPGARGGKGLVNQSGDGGGDGGVGGGAIQLSAADSILVEANSRILAGGGGGGAGRADVGGTDATEGSGGGGGGSGGMILLDAEDVDIDPAALIVANGGGGGGGSNRNDGMAGTDGNMATGAGGGAGAQRGEGGPGGFGDGDTAAGRDGANGDNGSGGGGGGGSVGVIRLIGSLARTPGANVSPTPQQ